MFGDFSLGSKRLVTSICNKYFHFLLQKNSNVTNIGISVDHNNIHIKGKATQRVAFPFISNQRWERNSQHQSITYFLSLQQAFFSGASTVFLFLQQASPLLQVLSLSSLQAGSLEQPSCPLPMNLPSASYIPMQAAFSAASQPIESHIAAHCSLVIVAHLLISHLPIISFSQCCISTQAAPCPLLGRSPKIFMNVCALCKLRTRRESHLFSWLLN